MADPRKLFQFQKKPKKSNKLQQMQFLDTKEPEENTLVTALNKKIQVLEALGNQFKLLYQKKVSEGQAYAIASTIISYNSDDIDTMLQKVRYHTLQLSANILQPEDIVKLGMDQVKIANLPTYLDNEIQRYSKILGNNNPQNNDTSVAEKEEVNLDKEDSVEGDDAESASLPETTAISTVSIVNSFTKANTSSEKAEVTSEEENEKSSPKKSKSS